MFDSNLQTWNSKSKHNGKKIHWSIASGVSKKGLTDRDDLTETVPRRHNGDDVPTQLGSLVSSTIPLGVGWSELLQAFYK